MCKSITIVDGGGEVMLDILEARWKERHGEGIRRPGRSTSATENLRGMASTDMEIDNAASGMQTSVRTIMESLKEYYAILLGHEIKVLCRESGRTVECNLVDAMERAMFNLTCSGRVDFMVDIMDRKGGTIVVRKKNNMSVLDFMRKMGDRLVSFHFGAVYSHDIAMRELMDGFKPTYRLFCMDFDARDTSDAFWWSQLAVVYMTSKLGQQRFGSSYRNDVMLCFTGGGWHCYWSNETFARVASSTGFQAVTKNLELVHPFEVNGESTDYVRGGDGYYRLVAGSEGMLDFLYKDDFETGRRCILCDLGDHEVALDRMVHHLPVRFTERFARWMEPKGIVASVMVNLCGPQNSLRVNAMIQRIVGDIDGGNFRSFDGFQNSLVRVALFARCNKEDRSLFFEVERVYHLILFCCVMFDCLESGMAMDMHMADPRHMLRGVFSPKVKPEVEDPGRVYLSYPLPARWYALDRMDRSVGSLTLGEACDKENPKLLRGVKRFRMWMEMLDAERESVF